VKTQKEALDVRNIYHKVKKYLALNFDKERGQVHLKKNGKYKKINWKIRERSYSKIGKGKGQYALWT
jgi:hypothetical protein